jgi:tetratricopeptide (TPR) repeat protein
VRILDHELGVAPLAETTALYEAVRNPGARIPPSPPQPQEPPPRPGPTAATPLVGRDHELEALLEVHRHVTRHGRVVVIEGEAGIGKTRLAEELLSRVGGDGTATLACRAFEEESSLSYAPIVQALRSRLSRDAPWLEDLSRNAREAAGRLLPELLAGQRASRTDTGVPGAEERFLAGVWETLVAATADTRSRGDAGVLVLDDAQWADDATMALLAYGFRRLSARRLLLVLTWRTPSERPLRRVLAELERSGEATVHRLPRLELSDVDAVARALRPDAYEPALVRRLFSETEGLPFLVVEYLRALTMSSEQWSVPEGARDLMRARLDPVSEIGRQLLAAAAVIGRSFDADAVRLTSGRAEDEVVTALEELAGHGLIRESGEHYNFSHETLRATVHADMSLARRRLLHRRAAQISPDSGSQARHLQMAGDAGAAATAHVRAAAQARSVFANSEALTHLRAALALGHPDPAALEVEAGELLTLLGDYSAAVASLERAAATADPLLLATIEHRLGQVHHRSGSWALAEAHFVAALAAAASPDDGRRARITADLSLTVLSAGDTDRARTLAADALAAAESAADTQALSQANNLLGLLASRAGATDQAEEHLQASLALAAAAGDHAAQVAALNNLALAYRDGGAIDAAVDRTLEALRLCAEEGDRHRQAALHNNLADLLHARGEGDEAMHHLKLAVAIFADVGAVADEHAEIWKLVQW